MVLETPRGDGDWRGGGIWLMVPYVKQNQISSETMTRDDFKRLIHVELRLRNFLGTCKSRSAKTGKYDSRINVKPNL